MTQMASYTKTDAEKEILHLAKRRRRVINRIKAGLLVGLIPGVPSLFGFVAWRWGPDAMLLILFSILGLIALIAFSMWLISLFSKAYAMFQARDENRRRT